MQEELQYALLCDLVERNRPDVITGRTVPKPEEIGPEEIGPEEIGPEEIGPGEIGPGEIGRSFLRSTKCSW